jgi:hypothetical protein
MVLKTSSMKSPDHMLADGEYYDLGINLSKTCRIAANDFSSLCGRGCELKGGTQIPLEPETEKPGVPHQHVYLTSSTSIVRTLHRVLWYTVDQSIMLQTNSNK